MSSGAAYFAAHGVPQAVQAALQQVLRERPSDPISSLGALLVQAAESRNVVSVDPRGLVDAVRLRLPGICMRNASASRTPRER